MHEMSIVAGILDIAENEARGADAAVINRIEVDVGALAGVEIPALEFAFEVARRGTMAGTAELVIHEIPGRGHCAGCDAEVEIDFATAVCPSCDGTLVTVTAGRELRVRSLDVD